jgi:hypothetical protein
MKGVGIIAEDQFLSEVYVVGIDALIDKVEMLAAVLEDAEDKANLLTKSILRLQEVSSGLYENQCCGDCDNEQEPC